MKEIDMIFDRLDKLALFPGYQLERRVDIFFALYLDRIINRRFHENITSKNIIPEFPLLKKQGKDGKQDYRPNRVDYAVFGMNYLYLIELKTSVGSRNKDQDKVLSRAKGKDLPALIHEAFKIRDESGKTEKYDYFERCLNDIGIDHKALDEVIYGKEIKIVYIQPYERPSDKEQPYTIITFEQIRTYIEQEDDAIAKRFCKSLMEWKNRK